MVRMREIHGTNEFRGARFTAVDLSGAQFRDVNLSGVRMVDPVMTGASFSGLIDGLMVNDIEVAPLIVAEMNRLYPERARLFADDPEGLLEAWSEIEAMWQTATERAQRLPDDLRRARVDDEWSFVETLRHLVFVIDGWISRTVLGEAHPYHQLGLPPSFVTDLDDVGIDPAADPTFDEVLDAHADRVTRVRNLLANITADELARRCPLNRASGYPPPTTNTVIECIHIVIDEEWAHHRYAVRDLAALEAGGPVSP
jgi:hypothetical protein